MSQTSIWNWSQDVLFFSLAAMADGAESTMSPLPVRIWNFKHSMSNSRKELIFLLLVLTERVHFSEASISNIRETSSKKALDDWTGATSEFIGLQEAHLHYCQSNLKSAYKPKVYNKKSGTQKSVQILLSLFWVDFKKRNQQI